MLVKHRERRDGSKLLKKYPLRKNGNEAKRVSGAFINKI